MLRFATLGVQSYHHDEVVTASRVLRGGFGHAMDAVCFSESTPPLYYAIAWVWTQLIGTGEFGLRSLSAVAGVATVPVAYLIGVELRGRRAGLMAAALVAVNPMLLWYSQEARAYALLALFCALSLLYCAAGGAARRAAATSSAGGSVSGLALATHYFVVFPILAEALMLLRRRGLRDSLAGSGHPRLRRDRWRRWRSTRCRSATPSGSATSPSGTGSGKPRRPSSPARPATSSPGPSGRCAGLRPAGAGLAALALLAFRGEPRGAPRRRPCRWPSAPRRSAIPVAMALVSRARTSSSPAT